MSYVFKNTCIEILCTYDMFEFAVRIFDFRRFLFVFRRGHFGKHFQLFQPAVQVLPLFDDRFVADQFGVEFLRLFGVVPNLAGAELGFYFPGHRICDIDDIDFEKDEIDRAVWFFEDTTVPEYPKERTSLMSPAERVS